LFRAYLTTTDILLNGIYWEEGMDRLFDEESLRQPDFKLVTIADITDDAFGSVPINLGDQTIENPVYGVDKFSLQKTAPYLANSVDVIAVGNLPNELPRDASRYFGEQLIKFILEDLLLKGNSPMLDRATLLKHGNLTAPFEYMRDYAGIA
jgi:hypothetical protein